MEYGKRNIIFKTDDDDDAVINEQYSNPKIYSAGASASVNANDYSEMTINYSAAKFKLEPYIVLSTKANINLQFINTIILQSTSTYCKIKVRNSYTITTEVYCQIIAFGQTQ